MAMTAADSIIVPLQCEFFALEGLSQLIKTIDRVKQNLNQNLTFWRKLTFPDFCTNELILWE